jgi:hypothetical protein
MFARVRKGSGLVGEKVKKRVPLRGSLRVWARIIGAHDTASTSQHDASAITRKRVRACLWPVSSSYLCNIKLS